VTTHDRKKKIIRSRMKALGEPYSVAKRQIEQIMPSDEHVRSYELTDEQKDWYADFFGIETSRPPELITSLVLPDVEEFMRNQEKAEGLWNYRNRKALVDNPDYVVQPFQPTKYDPKIRVSIYQYGGLIEAGRDTPEAFEEFLHLEAEIKKELGSKLLAVVPIGSVETDSEGKVREISGSNGGAGFRVWESNEDASFTHPLTGDWMREHAFRAKVLPILRSVFGLDDLLLFTLASMARRSSKVSLAEAKVVFPEHVTLAALLDEIPVLEKALGVNFVRVVETKTKGMFNFFVSDELDLYGAVDIKDLKVLNPRSIVLRDLYRAEAAYKQHLGHHLIEQPTLPGHYKSYSAWVKYNEWEAERFGRDTSYYEYLEDIRTWMPEIYEYDESTGEYIKKRIE
jgi:hypothetical protein